MGVWIEDGIAGAVKPRREASEAMKKGSRRPIDKQMIPAKDVPMVEAHAAIDAAMNGSEAAVDVLKAMNSPQVRGYLTSELDKAGATVESAAKVIAEAQSANGAQVVSYLGEASVVDTGPDHAIRLRAAEMNLKARGELTDREGVSIFMQMTDEQLAGIAAGTLDPATIIDLGPRVNEARSDG